MLMPNRFSARAPLWSALLAAALIAVVLSVPATRNLVARALGSLRMQKVQAVNVDLSPFTDPNANPALHQMVAQMISDKVVVTLNESDQPAPDSATAARLAGFPVQLLSARKDSPKLVVGGGHAFNMTVDRPRLQEIVKASGHPEIALPASLDNAVVSVQIPHELHAQYGTCPQPATAGNNIANQVIDTPPSATQYADCVRLTEGPSPTVSVPAGLDLTKLAKVGLEVGGMTPAQADNFFSTVDWKSTLTLTVPRMLRSYEQVQIGDVNGVLLTMAGRRGPGYTLIWAKKGVAFALVGFGDSGQAIPLAKSLK